MENNVEYLKSKKDLEEDNDYQNFVLDFTASWCGPCKHIAPDFENLSKEDIFQHVKFYKVDVDENEELCEEYDINCMPTFVFLKDKKKVDLLSGASAKVLREKLEINFCKTEEEDLSKDADNSNKEAEVMSSNVEG